MCSAIAKTLALDQTVRCVHQSARFLSNAILNAVFAFLYFTELLPRMQSKRGSKKTKGRHTDPGQCSKDDTEKEVLPCETTRDLAASNS